MPIEKIDIDNFLTRSLELPTIDVRSPGEYNHAHIPGAFSVPLFTDEQRAIIGTAYTRESRKAAVDHGLEYFSGRMKKIPEDITHLLTDWKVKNDSSFSAARNPGLIIHCWRGGMRSEAVAWLLNLYGYNVYLLKGGYKSFRRWGLSQFDKHYSLKVIGGYTGSGKTDVLKELKRKEEPVLDLEGLANHKGSAFGSLGENPQPTHEMFENILAVELWKVCRADYPNGSDYTKSQKEIWIEDESVHIGRVGIPKNFWKQMQSSPLYFIDIPFKERVNHIVATYGAFDKNALTNCILKIQKRLGGLNTKNAIHLLSENKHREAFSILIQYYDKMYERSLRNRDNIQSLLKRVTCNKVDNANAAKVADPLIF